MRKLKLQMQLSLDAYVAGPNGEMDWMVWNWDEALMKYVTELTESVDQIILGRKLAEGFIPHWTAAKENPENPEHAFAWQMVDREKIVFTRTMETCPWENT